jgi:hypothetical protein
MFGLTPLWVTRRILRELSPGCLHGQVEFVFGCVQMLFGFGSVAFHIVVVGGSGALHFVDRLDDMLMAFVQVVPVVDLCRHGDTGNKRHSKSRNGKNSLHGFSSDWNFPGAGTEMVIVSNRGMPCSIPMVHVPIGQRPLVMIGGHGSHADSGSI